MASDKAEKVFTADGALSQYASGEMGFNSIRYSVHL
jgi:hypothetical protein